MINSNGIVQLPFEEPFEERLEKAPEYNLVYADLHELKKNHSWAICHHSAGMHKKCNQHLS